VIPSLEMLGVVRAAVESWSRLTHHPGLLVPVEGCVASELDGSPSLVVVHSYVPGAITLAQAHLQPSQVTLVGGGGRCVCVLAIMYFEHASKHQNRQIVKSSLMSRTCIQSATTR